MGLFLSKFKRKQTTTEILEDIDKEINRLQRNRKVNQDRQKQFITTLIIYSIVAYVIGAVIFFCVFFPDTWQLRLVYSLPLLIFPVLICGIKKALHWYYVQRISSNDEALDDLKDRKNQILEDVMETETYKKAREILEKFDPVRLRKLEGSPEPEHQIKATPGTVLQQRIVQRADISPMLCEPGLSAAGMDEDGKPYFSASPARSSLAAPQPRAALSSQAVMSGEHARPPGPPMPRSVLSRERGTMERLMDYLVGDGPENRYALICLQCCSHNGMALKEEFEYLSFRCCYCFSMNPARKQRPMAPRLEFFAPRGLESHKLGGDRAENCDESDEDKEDCDSLQSSTSTDLPPTSLLDPTNSTINLADPTNLTTSLADPIKSTINLADPTNLTTSLADPTNLTASLADPIKSPINLTDPTNLTTSLAGSANTAMNLADPANSAVNLGDPRNSTMNLYDPANSTMNLCDPANSAINLCDPTNSIINLADPTNLTTSLADPANSTINLADPANLTTSLADPANSAVNLTNSVLEVASFTLSLQSDCGTIVTDPKQDQDRGAESDKRSCLQPTESLEPDKRSCLQPTESLEPDKRSCLQPTESLEPLEQPEKSLFHMPTLAEDQASVEWKDYSHSCASSGPWNEVSSLTEAVQDQGPANSAESAAIVEDDFVSLELIQLHHTSQDVAEREYICVSVKNTREELDEDEDKSSASNQIDSSHRGEGQGNVPVAGSKEAATSAQPAI